MIKKEHFRKLFSISPREIFSTRIALAFWFCVVLGAIPALGQWAAQPVPSRQPAVQTQPVVQAQPVIQAQPVVQTQPMTRTPSPASSRAPSGMARQTSYVPGSSPQRSRPTSSGGQMAAVSHWSASVQSRRMGQNGIVSVRAYELAWGLPQTQNDYSLRGELDNDHYLTVAQGPRMILVACFEGQEDARQQAQQLTAELRQQYGIEAWYIKKKMKIDERIPFRGVDRYGEPARGVYQKYSGVDRESRKKFGEYAVLVGNFATPDAPDVKALLERIKKIRPKALASTSTRRSTQVQMEQQRDKVNMTFRDASGKTVREAVFSGDFNGKGTMETAFVTRNPLLPPEQGGVPAAIYKLNKEIPYSLVHCPGKYSLRVKTYKGGSSFMNSRSFRLHKSQKDGAKKDEEAVGSGKKLIEAAQKADELTQMLRHPEFGYDAYVFHGETESFVTVGSFDRLFVETPNGRVLDPDLDAALRKFDSYYGSNQGNTPAGPGLTVSRPTTEVLNNTRESFKGSRAEQFIRSMSREWSPQQAPQNTLKSFGDIPFDLEPKPVPVPQESLVNMHNGR